MTAQAELAKLQAGGSVGAKAEGGARPRDSTLPQPSHTGAAESSTSTVAAAARPVPPVLASHIPPTSAAPAAPAAVTPASAASSAPSAASFSSSAATAAATADPASRRSAPTESVATLHCVCAVLRLIGLQRVGMTPARSWGWSAVAHCLLCVRGATASLLNNLRSKSCEQTLALKVPLRRCRPPRSSRFLSRPLRAHGPSLPPSIARAASTTGSWRPSSRAAREANGVSSPQNTPKSPPPLRRIGTAAAAHQPAR